MANALTRFQQFWATLTEKEQSKLFDIFSALRGPDQIDNKAKQFTMEIRYRTFGRRMCDKSFGGTMRFNQYPARPLTPAGVLEAQLAFKGNLKHYKDHVTTAQDALKRFGRKITNPYGPAPTSPTPGV